MIQLQVLNYILQNKDASLISEDNLDSSYFTEYEKEYNYIKEHLHKYSVIPDVPTFMNEFPNWEYIKVEEPRDYLLHTIVEDRNFIMSAKGFNEARDFLNSGKVNEFWACVRKYDAQIKESTAIPSQSYIDIQSRKAEYHDKVKNYSKYYITTGFRELDDICGGWSTDELAVIAARPGVGKSWILTKSAIAAMLQKLRVGFYSGEMYANQVRYRIDTILSHISNFDIMRGSSTVLAKYDNFLDTLPGSEYFLKILTPQELGGEFATISDLESFAISNKLDILFVDQYSLLKADGNFRAEHEKFASLSMAMKRLQNRLGIPIIVASQQNREKTDGSPSTANVAQSDRISQDCTMNIFLETEKNSPILKMVVTKNRNGEHDKTLSYNVDFNHGIFTFVNENNNETAAQDMKEFNTFNQSDTDEVNF